MGADGVVVAPPGLNEELGFLEGVEGLSAQELVGQSRIEALNVSMNGCIRVSQGEPGSMKAVRAPAAVTRGRRASATKPGSLSDLTLTPITGALLTQITPRCNQGDFKAQRWAYSLA